MCSQDDVRRRMCAAGDVHCRRCAPQDVRCRRCAPQEMCTAGDVRQDVLRRRFAPQEMCAAGCAPAQMCAHLRFRRCAHITLRELTGRERDRSIDFTTSVGRSHNWTKGS
ncbi:unnamed protein product [Pleuronectes platessa]|uniref:Uncharacterized protein n=1 Tax=Pleuronectes platessa TaxID=8262 RepID=A0A9N7TLE0_PLEPL|nr:unnamed protein product [Pleuronectes platessa]